MSWPCTFCTARQGTAEWLKDRDGKITGSSIAAIRGENPYESDPHMIAMRIWARDRPEAQIAVNDAMLVGTKLEPLIRAAFAESMRVTVAEYGLAVWKANPLIAASVDGIFEIPDLDATEPGTMIRCLLEIKTTRKNDVIYGAEGSKPFCRMHVEQMNYTAGIVGAKRIYYVVYDRKYLPEGSGQRDDLELDPRGRMFVNVLEFDPQMFDEQVAAAVAFDAEYRTMFQQE